MPVRLGPTGRLAEGASTPRQGRRSELGCFESPQRRHVFPIHHSILDAARSATMSPRRSTSAPSTTAGSGVRSSMTSIGWTPAGGAGGCASIRTAGARGRRRQPRSRPSWPSPPRAAGRAADASAHRRLCQPTRRAGRSRSAVLFEDAPGADLSYLGKDGVRTRGATAKPRRGCTTPATLSPLFRCAASISTSS